MKRWNVVIEVFTDAGKKHETVVVEAGNKKLAALRALSEITRRYSDCYKNVTNIEEVFA